ncbi:unnamed protein product [Oppiella nova]|uniref:RRM domain-containing protein n=1 Tax=Oppiella nova TaxID=334625 RepID=A0A7R9MJP7_9ACAR|nr:unnamed protein product [Oppiella nova]CAG2178602.1 unnamed protein product [Oppiella nova]
MSERFRHECPEGCKVFVGNLDRKTGREDLRHIFGRFGRVLNVWMATSPPGFGFVMYGHREEARTAVQRMDNARIDGRFVTVELATGLRRHDHNHHKRGHSVDRHSSGGRYRRSRSSERLRRRSNGAVDGEDRVGGDERRVTSSSGRYYRCTTREARSRSPARRRRRYGRHTHRSSSGSESSAAEDTKRHQ